MLVFMIKFNGKKNLQQGVSEGLNVNKKLRVTKIVLITTYSTSGSGQNWYRGMQQFLKRCRDSCCCPGTQGWAR